MRVTWIEEANFSTYFYPHALTTALMDIHTDVLVWTYIQILFSSLPPFAVK